MRTVGATKSLHWVEVVGSEAIEGTVLWVSIGNDEAGMLIFFTWNKSLCSLGMIHMYMYNIKSTCICQFLKAGRMVRSSFKISRLYREYSKVSP